MNSYAALQSTEFNKIKFTVQLGASEPKASNISRQLQAPQIEDGHNFSKGYFTNLSAFAGDLLFHSDGKGFLSRPEGSAIGNQISPSLANIAVSYKEQQWYDSHRSALEALRSQVYIIRYVDNRLVLCSDTTSNRWFFQQFLAPYFYGHPVGTRGGDRRRVSGDNFESSNSTS